MNIPSLPLPGADESMAIPLPVMTPGVCCSICRHSAAAAEVVNATNSETHSTSRITACAVMLTLPAGVGMSTLQSVCFVTLKIQPSER